MVNHPPLLTRRDFIGTTAAAGAGLLLTSCSPDTVVGQKEIRR